MSDIIATNDFEIPTKSEISSIYKIRNGRLWAILVNKTLLYADLNAKTKPLIKKFPHIQQCQNIFVSPDGEFCLIRTEKKHFHIYSKDLEPYPTPIPPDMMVKCATFAFLGKLSKPYIFMGTEDGRITFINLNKNITSTTLLPIVIGNFSIEGISFVAYKNGYFGLSVIIDKAIIPYILLPDFLENKAPSSKTEIPHLILNSIFCENNLIGILTKEGAFEFVINNNAMNPRREQQLSNQFFYAIDSNDVFRLSMFEGFVLVFTKSGQIKVFCNNIFTEVETFEIPGAKMYDYDTDTGDLYAIYPNKISKVRANFYCFLRLKIIHKFLQTHQEEYAASIITKIPSITIHEMLQFAEQNALIRFYIFMQIVNKMRTNKEITQQKIAMAHAAVLSFVQVEVMKPKPNVDDFCQFTKKLMEDNFIDKDSVISMLNMYGWEDPIPFITDPLYTFNCLMQQGKTKDAVKHLLSISNDDDFCNAALRIYKYEESETCKAISARKIISRSRIIPILMRKSSSKYVLSFLKKEELDNVWINRIFCLFLAEKPEQELVDHFFVIFRYYETEIPFLIRSMIAVKQFIPLAYGLVKITDYLSATSVASKGDPFFAFDIVAMISDPEIRKRCATRILRSLKKHESGRLAQKLLENFEKSGVEPTLLMEFLPRDTIGADLTNVVESFAKNNIEVNIDSQKSINEALNGCTKAEKLIEESEEKSVALASTMLCDKCRRPLFIGSGVVYPCSHIIHKNCAKEIVKYIQSDTTEEKIDYLADCPICGFLSVRLIDQPFRRKPDKKYDPDPWSVDLQKLMKIAMPKKKSMMSLSKNEK